IENPDERERGLFGKKEEATVHNSVAGDTMVETRDLEDLRGRRETWRATGSILEPGWLPCTKALTEYGTASLSTKGSLLQDGLCGGETHAGHPKR
ncbi:MAG TPA: hypothetical protein VK359_08515, partial [Rubrobacteraceae bacterium]|nr:hypothetical protein [Rubrobacteraceae bacterium]